MLNFDLQFARGDFVLDATADVGDGVTGVYGPSGSGKSTLLALLAGLLFGNLLLAPGRNL